MNALGHGLMRGSGVRRPTRAARTVTMLAAVVLLAAALVTIADGAAPAYASAWGSTHKKGVTVVVDFTKFHGKVEVGCDPRRPATGLAALRAAGFRYTFVPRPRRTGRTGTPRRMASGSTAAWAPAATARNPAGSRDGRSATANPLIFPRLRQPPATGLRAKADVAALQMQRRYCLADSAALPSVSTTGVLVGSRTVTAINRQVRLAARPSGLPKGSDWKVTTEPVPTAGQGQFVVAISHLSIDPAMRGWMNAGASYIPPVEVGAVMRAGAIGQVTASDHPGFAVGDDVYGAFGVQEYASSDGTGVIKLDTSLAEPTTYLGALGISGLTAYFGLLDVGRIQAGDTVVVSGAAGAVGSVAGQIAKLKGCRVIGIAGGQDKCRTLLDEFGFDAAIDYKSENLRTALREHAPGGVDVYFDNVGGDVLDAVLTRLARGARIIICGAVSQYNAERVQGPAHYLSLLVARASMTGMVVFDYQDRYPQAMAELAGWLRDGQLVSREHIVQGSVSDFPDVLLMLFAGENTGKLILAIDHG
jgi:NADPH-dependent curcumin reductase CurA